MMNPLDEHRLMMTRRHFFSLCSFGIGTAALASLLKENGLAVGLPGSDDSKPGLPHFAPKACDLKDKIAVTGTITLPCNSRKFLIMVTRLL